MGPWPLGAQRKQLLPVLLQTLADLLLCEMKCLGQSGNRLALDENVFAGKFAARIATLWRISLGFNTVISSR